MRARRIVVDLDRNACFHLHVEALLPVAPEVAMRCLTLYGECSTYGMQGVVPHCAAVLCWR